MEKSKVFVMGIVMLMFGICLGMPLGSGSSYVVGVNHWTRDTDNTELFPTNAGDNASLENGSLLWANLSSFAGSNIDWNGGTMKFDGLGAGGIGNPFDQDLNTTDPAIFTTLDTGQGALELYEVLPAWMTDWNTSFGWGDHPNVVGDGDPFFNASDAFPLQAAWMDTWNDTQGVSNWTRVGTDIFTKVDGDSVVVNGSIDCDNFTIDGDLETGFFLFRHPETNNYVFYTSADSFEFRSDGPEETRFFNPFQLRDGKTFGCLDTTNTKFIQLYHDGTDGIIRVSGGEAKLNTGTNLNANSNYIHGLSNLSLDNYEFPSADGSADQVLKSDGNGDLTWQNDNGSGSSLWGEGDNTLYSDAYDVKINKSLNVSNHIHLDTGSAVFGANESDQTLLVTPGGRDTQVFAFNAYDSQTGLKFDTSNYNGIVFNFQGTDIAFWNMAGADAGDMTVTDGAGDWMFYDNSANSIHIKNSIAAGSDTDTNYTSDGIAVDTGGTSFYSSQYPSARNTFEGTAAGGYQWTGTTGTPLALIQIVGGEVQGLTGFKIDDVDGDWIDDSSHGSTSNAMYIGNQQITTSSDIRIKKNITETEVDALKIVDDLHVVDFEWDDPTDTAPINKNSRGRWTGMIAQETVDVVPWIINAPRNMSTMEIDYASSNIWNVEYHNLVPVLVKAIQEQQDVIDEQEDRMDGIESRLDRLERNPLVRMFS